MGVYAGPPPLTGPEFKIKAAEYNTPLINKLCDINEWSHAVTNGIPHLISRKYNLQIVYQRGIVMSSGIYGGTIDTIEDEDAILLINKLIDLKKEPLLGTDLVDIWTEAITDTCKHRVCESNIPSTQKSNQIVLDGFPLLGDNDD